MTTSVFCIDGAQNTAASNQNDTLRVEKARAFRPECGLPTTQSSRDMYACFMCVFCSWRCSDSYYCTDSCTKSAHLLCASVYHEHLFRFMALARPVGPVVSLFDRLFLQKHARHASNDTKSIRARVASRPHSQSLPRQERTNQDPDLDALKRQLHTCTYRCHARFPLVIAIVITVFPYSFPARSIQNAVPTKAPTPNRMCSGRIRWAIDEDGIVVRTIKNKKQASHCLLFLVLAKTQIACCLSAKTNSFFNLIELLLTQSFEVGTWTTPRLLPRGTEKRWSASSSTT